MGLFGSSELSSDLKEFDRILKPILKDKKQILIFLRNFEGFYKRTYNKDWAKKNFAIITEFQAHNIAEKEEKLGMAFGFLFGMLKNHPKLPLDGQLFEIFAANLYHLSRLVGDYSIIWKFVQEKLAKWAQTVNELTRNGELSEPYYENYLKILKVTTRLYKIAA